MNDLTLNEEAKKILDHADLKDRHSFFQLSHFIIGKEPTIQSKLWQCVREINPRLETLKSLDLEIENYEENYKIIEIRIDILKNKIDNLVLNPNNNIDVLKAEILKIKKAKLERSISTKDINKEKLVKKKEMIEEELDFFVKTFKELEKVEKIKKWDDFNVQNDIWTAKLGTELNLRVLLNLPTDLELCKTVLSLPEGNQIKKQLVGSLKNIQTKIGQLNNENTSN